MDFTKPSLAGFVTFLRSVADIPIEAIPDNSPIIEVAYCTAKELVNLQIQRVSCLLYGQALYNLATSNLINYAPDPTSSPQVKVGDQEYPFFEALRLKWNLLSFVPGVIRETHDESTGQGLEVPDALRNLTIADLQYLKDPYGRQYLAIAQRAGSLWGRS